MNGFIVTMTATFVGGLVALGSGVIIHQSEARRRAREQMWQLGMDLSCMMLRALFRDPEVNLKDLQRQTEEIYIRGLLAGSKEERLSERLNDLWAATSTEDETSDEPGEVLDELLLHLKKKLRARLW